ncbi:enterochelin esterase [Nakamurella leprariae]|uniref:Enterochelin esterase n=1 Tax=Nakamurella leprariae TaxID=2803911 RepID=A0A938Y5V9_9ACTN|nr:enterochelin esterase [Nakamurella leprariae]MBM9466350.1 enterochelin esterase [Nakamurella leprariae]
MPPGSRTVAPAPTVADSPLLAELLEQHRRDDAQRSLSPAFWVDVARRGTPLVEAGPAADRMLVTFLFRADPRSTAQVYLELLGVTDRSQLAASSLRPVEGTDVWWVTLELPSDWRSTYRLVPSPDPLVPPAPAGTRAERSWWVQVTEAAQPDPYQLQPARRVHHRTVSRLAGPDAPDQSWWSAPVAFEDRGETTHLRWASEQLGVERTVWVHRTKGASADGDLLVLVDGRVWIEDLHVDALADRLVADGRQRPLTVVMIDSVDPARRRAELPPNPAFLWAVVHELLPTIKDLPTDPARTVVAGPSFGGLFALFAALTAPQRFGRALALSGSFWWPGNSSADVDLDRFPQAEYLTHLIQRGVPDDLRVHLRVGLGEFTSIDPTLRVADALGKAGVADQPHVHRFAGGHDWTCWQDGLVAGLADLLPLRR